MGQPLESCQLFEAHFTHLDGPAGQVRRGQVLEICQLLEAGITHRREVQVKAEGGRRLGQLRRRPGLAQQLPSAQTPPLAREIVGRPARQDLR